MRNINLKPNASFKKDDQRRMVKTISFIKEIEGTVLDIGYPNPVGNFIAKWFNVKKENTFFDLDFPNFTKKKYDNIWIFEVIEHLMNPLLFLIELKKVCTKETRIFLTYPIRPRFFWAKTHFHEYDRQRFRYMLNEAEYKIIRYQQKIHWRPDWWFYLSGIRPFLRLTIGCCKQQFYELKI